MIALVDCNNFYASCERVFQPNLVGKPVAVLSNNDGCIIARSDEVKALNIPMGAPIFKWIKQCEAAEVTLFSANFTLYGDMSDRVMSILEDNCPEIEIYSIDEAFLHYQNAIPKNINTFGEALHKTIKKSTGLPTSVGFATSKTLAKMANKIARKFPKETKNVFIINSETKRIKALKWVKIEDVWGIGRNLAKTLYHAKVKTAYDYTQLSDSWIKRNISVVGLRLKQELLGKPVIGSESLEFTKKNIATTRSFVPAISNIETLEDRISTFAVTCAEKLRLQNSVCRSVYLFIRTSRHKRNLPQYKKSIVLQMPSPSNSNIEIVKLVKKGLQLIYKKGYQYKRAGVIAMDICPNDNLQLNIFDLVNEKHTDLMKSIDAINKRMGRGKVRLASQTLGKDYWKMKQEHLSRNYTTNLNEIIEIHV